MGLINVRCALLTRNLVVQPGKLLVLKVCDFFKVREVREMLLIEASISLDSLNFLITLNHP